MATAPLPGAKAGSKNHLQTLHTPQSSQEPLLADRGLLSRLSHLAPLARVGLQVEAQLKRQALVLALGVGSAEHEQRGLACQDVTQLLPSRTFPRQGIRPVCPACEVWWRTGYRGGRVVGAGGPLLLDHDALPGERPAGGVQRPDVP
jgi:hypothetical protein